MKNSTKNMKKIINIIAVSILILFGILFNSCEPAAEIFEFNISEQKFEGRILDIEPGTHSIVSEQTKKPVAVIDSSEFDLRQLDTKSLKILMKAADMKFIDETFHTITSFCSLNRMKAEQHSAIFSEAFRVLKTNGQFHVWDILIPESKYEATDSIICRIKAKIRHKTMTDEYIILHTAGKGTAYYTALAKKAGFQVKKIVKSNNTFHLIFSKPENVAESDTIKEGHHHSSDESTYYFYDKETIALQKINTAGYILDIGGGGEGVIGQLNGEQVVAIDISEQELAEAPGDVIKIVMDGSDLKFLDNTFSAVSIFYTLMYMDSETQKKVLEEVHRVLKPGGKLLIWDIEVPTQFENNKNIAVIPLTITLPDKEIETGYGYYCPDIEHNIEYYLKLAEKTGFEIARQQSGEKTFFLELTKR